jgi:hypothetical protein
VTEDPSEQHDLSDQEPARRDARARALATELEAASVDARRYPRGGQAQLPPEDVERLRELGYFER